MYQTIPDYQYPIVSDSNSNIELTQEPIRRKKLSNIRECRDSLTTVKDNYAHFISADCTLTTPIGKQLIDLELINDDELRKAKPHKWQVLVTRKGTYHVFSMVNRNHSYEQISPTDLVKCLEQLKLALV